MSGHRLRGRADSHRADEQERAAAWTRIAQLFSNCGRDLRRAVGQQAAACGLTDTEYLLLFVCRGTSSEGLAQQDIAEAIGVSPGQISGLVDRLQQRGLLQNHRSTSDRRRQLWSLTSEGRQRLQQALREFSVLADELDCRLTSGDRTRIEKLAADVRQCLRTAMDAAEANGARQESAAGHLTRKAS